MVLARVQGVNQGALKDSIRYRNISDAISMGGFLEKYVNDTSHVTRNK